MTSPQNAPDRPCRLCEHWGGDAAGDENAICVRETHPRIQANKHRGCVFWVRAIGVDREPPSADASSFEQMFPDDLDD